jgi:hypothetical protein
MVTCAIGWIKYCINSGDTIEKNEMGGACSACVGEERRTQRGGKLEGKRPLQRPRPRWEDNEMDLREVGRGVRTGLSWLRIGTGGGHL